MITIVIPAYKKTEELVKRLKNNLPFFSNSEVIVVNDDPEKSLKILFRIFPTIKLLENKQNLGFAGAVNRGIMAATNPYIFLLNSDVGLTDDSYKKALDHFKTNRQLFAVTFSQKEKDGSIVGKNTLSFRRGMIAHAKAKQMTTGVTAWAEGGSSIFDRTKLLELGLFDTIYKPFYWEDIDLSYRAWKAGYEVLFDESIIVDHVHESTIGTFFKKKDIKIISYRNSFIFIWKNITAPSLFIAHLVMIPCLIFWYGIVKREKSLIIGFFRALAKIGIIRRRRALLSDKDVLKKFI